LKFADGHVSIRRGKLRFRNEPEPVFRFVVEAANKEHRMTLEAAVPVQVVVEASESDDRTLVVHVCGELDMESRDSIEPALMAAVASAEAIVLDLGKLMFCDSTGIAMFCAVHEKAVAEARPLVFRNVRGIVRRAFALTGVDANFELTE
jgi:anti-sigma B factor antagonist